MQSMDLKIFCPRCREPTYREVRYRSDPQFIGRVLVCEHCGERILEPLGSGRECEDCWRVWLRCGCWTYASRPSRVDGGRAARLL